MANNNNSITFSQLVGTLLLISGYILFTEGLTNYLKGTFAGLKNTDLILIGGGILFIVYIVFNKAPALFFLSKK